MGQLSPLHRAPLARQLPGGPTSSRSRPRPPAGNAPAAPARNCTRRSAGARSQALGEQPSEHDQAGGVAGAGAGVPAGGEAAGVGRAGAAGGAGPVAGWSVFREVGPLIGGGGQGERQQDEEEGQEQGDAAHGGRSPSKPRGGGVRAYGSSSV